MNGLKLQTRFLRKKVVGIAVLLLLANLMGLVIATDETRLISLLLGSLLLSISMWQHKLLIYSFVVATVCFFNELAYAESPLLYFGVNIYVGDVFIFLFVLSTFFLALSKKGHKGLQSSLGISIALYLVWGAICVLRGIPVWGHSAVGESRFILWASAYFPVVQSIRKKNELDWFLTFSVVLILIYLMYVLVRHYLIEFGGDIGWMFESRLMGGHLGLLLVAVFVFCLISILTGAAEERRGVFLALVILTGALVPFAARTAWIGFIVSTLFVVFLLLRRVHLKSLIPLLVVIIVLLGSYMYFGLFGAGEVLDPGTERGLGFATEAGRLQGTSAWRLIGWHNLLTHTLRSNPIFGEGFGGYYDIFELELRGIPPHNDWLVIFSKMGLVGLILFINIVIQFYRTGFRFVKCSHDVQGRAYMQAFMAIFLAGLVGGTFFFFFPFMWIAAGLQTALLNISEKKP